MQANLTLALGTHTFTPLEIATGYAILANEGFKVEPWLIERIENADGEIVYAADPLVACPDCANADSDAAEEVRMEDILGTAVPEVRAAERVMDPRVAFIISSFLNDAISAALADAPASWRGRIFPAKRGPPTGLETPGSRDSTVT